MLTARGVLQAAITVARWQLFGIGLGLIAVGIAARTWAVALLGRSCTVQVRVRPDQEVVDRGPFAVVRHPSYTGLLLVFLGVGAALGNWGALALAIVPSIAALVYRIHVEESALTTRLGAPYRDYRARVRYRLVPGVW